MPKARNDYSHPPLNGLDRPIYVLRMNWWHWSDANRLKWLIELRSVLLATVHKVEVEIGRIDRAIKAEAGWKNGLCPLAHRRGVRCDNKPEGCRW